MFPIVRLAAHRDIEENAEAIAEIVRHQLQHLETENPEEGIGRSDLEVKVAINDSSLDLQIHTNSVLDKEKLLTLVRSELQNLQIESVAKVKVHCWRNDEDCEQNDVEELSQPIPLWTEKFMLEPSRLSKYQDQDQDLDVDLERRSPEIKRSPEGITPETRALEPQLSKHSVLQQAIAQIATTSDHAKKHLVLNDLHTIDGTINSHNLVNGDLITSDSRADSGADSGAKTDIEDKHQAAIDNSYWQLLVVGGSIVLLGLGIGAMVRALTLKNLTDKALISASETSVAIASTPPSSSAQKDLYPGSETTTPASTLNNSGLSTNSSPPPSSPNQTVTLEKFNLIQKGMTIEQVEKIFGLSGRIIAETNSPDTVGRVYSWKNQEGSNAIVEFKDGQVVAKAQAGL